MIVIHHSLDFLLLSVYYNLTYYTTKVNIFHTILIFEESINTTCWATYEEEKTITSLQDCGYQNVGCESMLGQWDVATCPQQYL